MYAEKDLAKNTLYSQLHKDVYMEKGLCGHEIVMINVGYR